MRFQTEMRDKRRSVSKKKRRGRINYAPCAADAVTPVFTAPIHDFAADWVFPSRVISLLASQTAFRRLGALSPRPGAASRALSRAPTLPCLRSHRRWRRYRYGEPASRPRFPDGHTQPLGPSFHQTDAGAARAFDRAIALDRICTPSVPRCAAALHADGSPSQRPRKFL